MLDTPCLKKVIKFTQVNLIHPRIFIIVVVLNDGNQILGNLNDIVVG